MPRIQLFKDEEIDAFDSPPNLTPSEQKLLFTTREISENKIRFRKKTAKLGFILQLGYFKYGKKCYTPDQFRNEDIKYVAKLLRLKKKPDLADYPKSTYVVHRPYKNDRVFRSLRNMVELIDRFNEEGVNFKSLSEPEFDTTSANGKFLLQILTSVAEFERNLISERTKVGLDNARKRNKLLGRPKGAKVETIEKYHYAKHLYENQGV